MLKVALFFMPCIKDVGDVDLFYALFSMMSDVVSLINIA